VAFRSNTGVAKAVDGEIGTVMLRTILVIFFVLWLLGVLTSYTIGGFIHLFLAVALVILVLDLVRGRKRIA
jgi:hypothetical protein